MLTRPALFDRTCKGSHRIAQRVELLRFGQPLTAVAGVQGLGANLPVGSGTVTYNRGSLERATVDLVLSDPRLLPTDTDAELAPLGDELRVWRGVVMPDRTTFLCCLGTFGIRSVDWTDGLFAGLHVTGLDRLKLISETTFPFPRSFYPESAFGRLRTVLLEPFASWPVPPSVTFDPTLADAWVPAASYPTDRGAVVNDLCTALGAEVTAPELGDFRVMPIPDPDGPVDEILDVVDNPTDAGVMVAPKRTVTRDGVFNAWVVIGASVDGGEAPTSMQVTDDNPDSPTRFGGPFGEVTDVWNLSNVTTLDQANTAAEALRRDAVGLLRSVSYTTPCNPSRQVGDVRQLHFSDGTVERHLSQRLTTPIGVGSQSEDTRTTAATS